MVNIEEQLKYIYKLKYINVESIKDYNKLSNTLIKKSLYLFCNININIIKLPNTLIKLYYWTNNNLNNLPLNLRYLNCEIAHCNVPPNIIYLDCYVLDANNLPRSLQFIYIDYDYDKIIPSELIDNIYDNKNIFYISFYKSIKKLKSIY